MLLQIRDSGVEQRVFTREVHPILLVAVTLFQPRIAPVVIAVRFPKSTSVLSHKLDAGHPFSALPEVEARNDKSDGVTMSSGKGLPIMLQGKKHVRLEKIIQR